MTFTPTPEQLSIVSAATSTKDNLIISALAGAAKTSTLVMVAEALAPQRMLCLAFNKRIATEMKDRLPPTCEAKTLNSLGHGIWSDVLGKRLEIRTTKSYDILSARLDTLPADEKKEAYGSLADLLEVLRQGKSSGWIPDAYSRKSNRLLSDDEFFASTDEKLPDYFQDLITAVACESLDQAFAGILDFDDQILLPTIFPAPFPRYPVVLIDEAQDLSPLNHAMLRKLVGTRRIIAVGDSCQAIYGFRGASASSMKELESAFSMTKLILSTSFRCPRSVVEHVRWRAPHMKYPDWAKQGNVRRWDDWTLDQIPPNAVVLCRNNAPLFSLAIKMLKASRYPELVGNDIGKGLLKIMRKLGKPNLPQDEVLIAIDRWLEEKKSKSRNHGPYLDKAECMYVFAKQGRTLDDAISYAEHVFNSQGSIKLMTVHRSKGLEFDSVFILEEKLIGHEGQERNLRYVAVTRTKDLLTYIDFEGLDEAPKLASAIPATM